MAIEKSMLPKDTTLGAARTGFSILRNIGLSGRAQMAFELSDGLRAIVECGIRQRHPEWDGGVVRSAALRLAIGDELFCKAHPGIELGGR